MIDPAVWALEPAAILRFFNHEIGHIMTGAPHSTACPSTMNSDFYDCGLETVDGPARAQAIARIRDGWWRQRGSPSL